MTNGASSPRAQRLLALLALLVLASSGAARADDSPSPAPEGSPAPAPEESPPQFSPGSCSFVGQQPRYYAVTAQAKVTGAANNVILNDAFLRALTRQLVLEPCQVVLTQGAACDATLAHLPCVDPYWACEAEDLTISASVYTAARTGACAKGGGMWPGSPICKALKANPAVGEAVAAGACQPTCLDAAPNSTAVAAPAPPPPPPPGRSPTASGCAGWSLQIETAKLKEAQAAAYSLNDASNMAAVAAGLAPFAAEGATLQLFFTNPCEWWLGLVWCVCVFL